MAEQHQTQYPGMLPSFTVNEGLSVQTPDHTTAIMSPATTAPQPPSREPPNQIHTSQAIQSPHPQLQGPYYGSGARIYPRQGYPAQFLGIAPNRIASPFGPQRDLQTGQSPHVSDTKDTDSDNDIIQPQNIHRVGNKAPEPQMPVGSAAATAISQVDMHSRVPLTEGERALKGPLLRDLIAKRYGPEDRKGDSYPYTRHGEVREDSKGRKGDIRFRVLQNGIEQVESKTAFEKRLAAEVKQKRDAENAAAAKQKEESARKMLESIQQTAASSKKRKHTKEKTERRGKLSKNDKAKKASKSQKDEVSIHADIAPARIEAQFTGFRNRRG
jgi:hypothetical protein